MVNRRGLSESSLCVRFFALFERGIVVRVMYILVGKDIRREMVDVLRIRRNRKLGRSREGSVGVREDGCLLRGDS